MGASNSETSPNYSPMGANNVFDVANLVLRLLPSKDGVVMRRLLMTADGPSLIRAIISKEGSSFRQQLCRIIADVLYQWTSEALGQSIMKSKYKSHMRLARGVDQIHDYQLMLTDRRLKVIFFKKLNSVRRDPILMLRLCWATLVLFVTASALASHRVLVSLSEAYIGPVSFVPKRFAIST